MSLSQFFVELENELLFKKNKQILIKIGNQLFEDCFDFSIPKNKYEKLLNIYKSKNKLQYKKYYIYSSFDKNLLIFKNGTNKCYKTLNYFFKDDKNYRIEYSSKYYLPNDLFQSEYEYDSIYQYHETYFNFNDNGDKISFIQKTNVNTKEVFYNIQISLENLDNLNNIEKMLVEILNQV